MANLLPKQSRQARLWQKRKRFLVISALASVVIMITVYASMLPVIIYTYIIDNEIPTLNNRPNDAGAQRKELKFKLEDYKKFIDSVTLVSNQRSIIDIIEEVMSVLQGIDSVELTRVEIRFVGGDYSIILAGTAADRSGVVVVRTALLTITNTDLTSFPVSNFAPISGVYNFTAKLTYPSSNSVE